MCDEIIVLVVNFMKPSEYISIFFINFCAGHLRHSGTFNGKLLLLLRSERQRENSEKTKQRVAKFRPLSYDQSLKYRVLLRVSDKMWARRIQLP